MPKYEIETKATWKFFILMNASLFVITIHSGLEFVLDYNNIPEVISGSEKELIIFRMNEWPEIIFEIWCLHQKSFLDRSRIEAMSSSDSSISEGVDFKSHQENEVNLWNSQFLILIRHISYTGYNFFILIY